MTIKCSINRSAGKNNLSGDELVSRLEECSSKWPKPSLQVLHKLWNEYGALIHAQQEVLGMLRIGRVRPTNMLRCSFSIVFDYINTERLISPTCYCDVCLQLVDMQWKLGMAVSSDTCRSLNSPYVSLLLKIAEPSGQICQRSFEMTIPQFQVCVSFFV